MNTGVLLKRKHGHGNWPGIKLLIICRNDNNIYLHVNDHLYDITNIIMIIYMQIYVVINSANHEHQINLQ